MPEGAKLPGGTVGERCRGQRRVSWGQRRGLAGVDSPPQQRYTCRTTMATLGETTQLGRDEAGFICNAVDTVALQGEQVESRQVGRREIWSYCNVQAALPVCRHAGVVVKVSKEGRNEKFGGHTSIQHTSDSAM